MAAARDGSARRAAPPLHAVGCPRCGAPMRALELSSHRSEAVHVEHCVDCRVVWFDRFESVHLDALGWVHLLRAMDPGDQRPLAEAQVARPACPTCSEPLRRVDNRSRFGRFAVLECPAGHGHLHAHAGLLAERGLVRPLGQAERRALAAEKLGLRCFNCGGAASARDDRCSWCGTPLVVVDVPRLMHSLRPRDVAQNASPSAAGHAVAWSCRGCGAALDPGRDTQCTSCGHLVVVQKLPDLKPLLDAAEAELQADRERRAAVRRRIGPATMRRRWGDRGRVSPAWRLLLLHGWLPLLLLAVVGAAGLFAFHLELPGLQPDPQGVLRLQTVRAVGPETWSLAAAYRRAAPGDVDGQRRLGRGLLDLQLRQRAGLVQPAPWTLGQILDGHYGRLFPVTDAELAESLGTHLARTLRIEPGSADDAWPAGADTPPGRLAWAAPGLWIESERRSRAVWAPRVVNGDVLPVTLGRIRLRTGEPRGPGLTWLCNPADPQQATLRPSQQGRLSCTTAQSPAHSPQAWTSMVGHLASAETPPLTWSAEDLKERGRIDALIAQAVAEGDRTPLRLSSPSWSQRRGLYGPPARWIFAGSVLALGLAAFVALRLLAGTRVAWVVWLLVSLPAAWVFGSGLGAASVLVIGAGAGVALVAGLLFTWAAQAYREFVMRPITG